MQHQGTAENTEINKLEDWVSLYTDDLYRWAVFKVKDRAVAQDLVQETFISAYKARESFHKKSKVKTWLFSILKNKIIDHFRRRVKYVLTSDLTEKNQSIDNLFDRYGQWNTGARPSAWQVSVPNPLDDHQFTDIFSNCMQQLPELWFNAIQLKYLEQKNGSEICKDLKITTSNFWQILRRARLQLRVCLEDNWFKK